MNDTKLESNIFNDDLQNVNTNPLSLKSCPVEDISLSNYQNYTQDTCPISSDMYTKYTFDPKKNTNNNTHTANKFDIQLSSQDSCLTQLSNPLVQVNKHNLQCKFINEYDIQNTETDYVSLKPFLKTIGAGVIATGAIKVATQAGKYLCKSCINYKENKKRLKKSKNITRILPEISEQQIIQLLEASEHLMQEPSSLSEPSQNSRMNNKTKLVEQTVTKVENIKMFNTFDTNNRFSSLSAIQEEIEEPKYLEELESLIGSNEYNNKEGYEKIYMLKNQLTSYIDAGISNEELSKVKDRILKLLNQKIETNGKSKLMFITSEAKNELCKIIDPNFQEIVPVSTNIESNPNVTQQSVELDFSKLHHVESIPADVIQHEYFIEPQYTDFAEAEVKEEDNSLYNTIIASEEYNKDLADLRNAVVNYNNIESIIILMQATIKLIINYFNNDNFNNDNFNHLLSIKYNEIFPNSNISQNDLEKINSVIKASKTFYNSKQNSREKKALQDGLLSLAAINDINLRYGFSLAIQEIFKNKLTSELYYTKFATIINCNTPNLLIGDLGTENVFIPTNLSNSKYNRFVPNFEVKEELQQNIVEKIDTQNQKIEELDTFIDNNPNAVKMVDINLANIHSIREIKNPQQNEQLDEVTEVVREEHAEDYTKDDDDYLTPEQRDDITDNIINFIKASEKSKKREVEVIKYNEVKEEAEEAEEERKESEEAEELGEERRYKDEKAEEEKYEDEEAEEERKESEEVEERQYEDEHHNAVVKKAEELGEERRYEDEHHNAVVKKAEELGEERRYKDEGSKEIDEEAKNSIITKGKEQYTQIENIFNPEFDLMTNESVIYNTNEFNYGNRFNDEIDENEVKILVAKKKDLSNSMTQSNNYSKKILVAKKKDLSNSMTQSNNYSNNSFELVAEPTARLSNNKFNILQSQLLTNSSKDSTCKVGMINDIAITNDSIEPITVIHQPILGNNSKTQSRIINTSDNENIIDADVQKQQRIQNAKQLLKDKRPDQNKLTMYASISDLVQDIQKLDSDTIMQQLDTIVKEVNERINLLSSHRQDFTISQKIITDLQKTEENLKTILKTVSDKKLSDKAIITITKACAACNFNNNNNIIKNIIVNTENAGNKTNVKNFPVSFKSDNSVTLGLNMKTLNDKTLENGNRTFKAKILNTSSEEFNNYAKDKNICLDFTFSPKIDMITFIKNSRNIGFCKGYDLTMDNNSEPTSLIEKCNNMQELLNNLSEIIKISEDDKPRDLIEFLKVNPKDREFIEAFEKELATEYKMAPKQITSLEDLNQIISQIQQMEEAKAKQQLEEEQKRLQLVQKALEAESLENQLNF